MMVNFDALKSYTVHAKDGDLGRVKDVYFDDSTWQIRYFVIDTHRWLPGRKVLLSPQSIDTSEPFDNRLPVNLTTEQIEKSPSIDEHMPVSRQYELELSQYYGWANYWIPPMPASDPFPVAPMGLGGTDDSLPREVIDMLDGEPDNSVAKLQSCHDLRKFRVATTDNETCDVSDFLFDTDDWRVTNLILDTGHWLPGKKVLCPHLFIDVIDWQERVIEVSLSKQTLKDSDEFAIEEFSEEYEARVVKRYFDSIGGPSRRSSPNAKKPEAPAFT